jgi:hypothetical protein
MGDLGQGPAGAPASPYSGDTLATNGVAGAPVPGSTSLAAPTPAGTERAGRTSAQVAKDILLFFAAPFITLAYMALMPSIALAMLARIGGQAGHHRKATG